MEKSVAANLHLPAAYNQAEFEPGMGNRHHSSVLSLDLLTVLFQLFYFSMIETSFVGFTVKGEDKRGDSKLILE